MRCAHCGGSNFDEDRARADLVCLDCGMVLSENVISAEVEFVETGNGLSAAVGRFVSDESQQVGRESKQVTENRARRRIDTICGQLRLGSDVSVSAFRFYQSALFRGFTRGRGAMQTAAGCIYLAARQLRVNLMLLDLSDAVGVNVYVLGHCYSDLKRKLNLSIPEMDPCLYIERFASLLEFGDKMSAVATTAMRLLQRMKKDWIATGRRPSGLAAAALLIASRIHEFNRTEEDVARVARISQQTTRKRLKEFGRTPSSKLSIDDFFTIDYEEEQDPPAFSATKKLDETVKEMDDEAFSRISAEIKELERRIENQLRVLAEKRTSSSFIGKLADLDVGRSKGLQHLLSGSDEQSASPKSDFGGSCSASSVSDATDTVDPGCVTRNVLRDVLDGVVEPELLDNCVEDLQILTEHSGDTMCELLSKAEELRNLRESQMDAKAVDEKSMESIPAVPTEPTQTSTKDDKPMKLPVFLPNVRVQKVEYPSTADGTLSLDDIDDEELDREYILQPREVMIKAAVWYKANADYLQTARRKRLAKMQQMEEETKNPAKKKARRTRRPRAPNRFATRDKFEPMDEESEDKPMSSKINYEALEAIVGASTSQPTTTTIQTQHTSSTLTPGPLLAATLLGDVPPSSSNVTPSRREPEVNQMATSVSSKRHVRFAVPIHAPEATGQQHTVSTVNEDANDDLKDEAIIDDEPVDLNEPQEDFYPEDDDDDDDSAWQDGNELW